MASDAPKGFTKNELSYSEDGTVTLTVEVNRDLAQISRYDIIKDGANCYKKLEADYIKGKLDGGLNTVLSRTMTVFRRFDSRDLDSLRARTYAMHIFRDKFLISHFLGPMSISRYDKPTITLEDNEANTLILKSLTGIEEYYSHETLPAESKACKRRNPGSFGHGTDKTECVDIPIKTDRLGFQVDNFNAVVSRVSDAMEHDGKYMPVSDV